MRHWPIALLAVLSLAGAIAAKKKNPDDIDDSALGAAVYLCGAGGSLADLVLGPAEAHRS